MANLASFADHLRDLYRLLHNIDDHTKVLQRLFAAGGLADPFLGTLMGHIRHEEAENQRQLAALKAVPGLPAYEIDTLIQHSRLLSELTGDTASDPSLVAEILHHFAEEHEWFAQTLAGLAPEADPLAALSSASPSSAPVCGPLTVGSLIAPQ